MKKVLLFIFTHLVAFAHPHYFLDTALEIKENVIKNYWKFDRLNSKILMFDYDKNKNKILDLNEKKEFLLANFYKLEDNNFNIFLANENEEIKVKPKNVDLIIDKKRLVIVFDIPYNLANENTFCTMDEKIYLAYKLEKLITNYDKEVQKSEYDFCIGVFK